jgi:hypothetical protein
MLTISFIPYHTNRNAFTMSSFDTNKVAEAEILLDNDHYFDSDAEDFSPELTKTDAAMNNDQNTSTPSSALEGIGQDADMVSHNVQHKKNVVVGVALRSVVGSSFAGTHWCSCGRIRWTCHCATSRAALVSKAEQHDRTRRHGDPTR